MEQLKQHLRDNIIFDEHDDENGDNFKSVLFEELYNNYMSNLEDLKK